MNPSAVLLNRAEHHPGALSGEELEYLLGMEEPEELKRLFEAAYRVKLRWEESSSARSDRNG